MTRLRRWSAVLGVWALVGLVSASQVWLASRSMGHDDVGFAAVAWWVMPVWLFWAPATAGVVWLARRFPLERGRLARSLPAHALAGTLFAVFHLAWWLAWTQAVSPYALEDRPVGEMMWVYVQARFNVSFLVYCAIVGATYAATYAERLRRRELDATRLERQLAEARLSALRARIHPHFLFNTLHAISTLVGRDPDRARRMIARLSDLMRLSLDRDESPEIALRDELEYVDVYLDIEQSRFADRLDVDFSIDPETLDARVPNLILQPLVENAIRHGIARLERKGTLRITAERTNGRLALAVVNDAPPDDAGPRDEPPSVDDGPAGRGLGLRLVRERLDRLYGDDQRFASGREDGTFVASLDLPFRAEPAR